MSIARFRTIKAPDLPGLQINYHPDKAYTFAQRLKVDNGSIINRLLIPAKIEQKPWDVLNFSVMTNTSKKDLLLSSQRNRLRRRWSGALVAALRNYGMNRDGSPLNGGFLRLQGMLELVIFQARGWEDPPEKLIEDAGKIIEAVIQVQMSKSIRHVRPGHRPWNLRNTGDMAHKHWVSDRDHSQKRQPAMMTG